MTRRRLLYWACLTCATLGLSIAHAQVSFETILSFSGTNGPNLGSVPEARLIQGVDGCFYGTTMEGGSNNLGTVFKLSTDGVLTTLHEFGSDTNGGYPQPGLIQGSDGALYGTASDDYIHPNAGAVFRITTNGVFTALALFHYTNGAIPNGVIQATDGNLYGTTYWGGAYDEGTVFRVTPAGTLVTIYSFGSLTNMAGVFLDGANPQASLAQADDGALYGTTVMGGTNGNFGTVYRITTNGDFTTLVSFNGTNGASPLSTLTKGLDGTLYGTTSGGGQFFSGTPYSGVGTVFGVSTSGVMTTLHYFAGYPDDGAQPNFVGLALGTDGSLFGTTFAGGTNGSGTVFQSTANGAWKLLHSFTRLDPVSFTNLDGYNVSAGLVQARDGSLYGVGENGGAYGLGCVFRISSSSFSAPQIYAAARGDASLQLRWKALGGRSYQPLSCTNLNQPTWTPEGGLLSLPDAIADITISRAPGIQRFYRVTLLP